MTLTTLPMKGIVTPFYINIMFVGTTTERVVTKNVDQNEQKYESVA